MRSLLLFGDSNTHGTMPMPDLDFDGRFDRDDRWAGRLAKLIPEWEVIAEGHPGRTTVHDDPVEGAHRNGLTVLPALLESHKPLDLVLIMLGTNDLKFVNRCRAFDAALGMENLVELTKRCEYMEGYAVPKILIMSPPAIVPTKDEFFTELWGHAGPESQLLAKHYARVAKETDCHFFDAGSVVSSDPTDGGHLCAAETQKLGEALVPVVKKILKM